MSYASHGAGTASQYAALMLISAAGLDLRHVPFSGSPPALMQVAGGQIAIMFGGIPSLLPLIKGGRLKPFAVAASSRSIHLPGVPTMAEQGYPEVAFLGWVGVVASATIPTATRGEMQDSDVRPDSPS
jgi:tripartite-type tricarboxylate transporter receptor subunit TctC